MNTFKLTFIINRTTPQGFTHQVIDYRGVLVTRQYSRLGDYLVTVDYGHEEIDFNHLVDALKWIEDELNSADQARYYRTQADLNREWAPRV